MTTVFRNMQRVALVVSVAAALLAPALPAQAQAGDQFVALPSYRRGGNRKNLDHFSKTDHYREPNSFLHV